jgi:hypothetical protein
VFAPIWHEFQNYTIWYRQPTNIIEHDRCY